MSARCTVAQDLPPLAGNLEKRGPAVLVVEDNQDGALVLEHLLRLLGYRPIMAGNAHDALSKLEGCKPNILVTDIRMRGMTGIELAVRILTDQRWANLPLVAYTGLTSDECRSQILGAGFKAIIQKPAEAKEFDRALREALSC